MIRLSLNKPKSSVAYSYSGEMKWIAQWALASYLTIVASVVSRIDIEDSKLFPKRANMRFIQTTV